MDSSSAEARFRDLYDRHHRMVLAYFLRRTDHSTAYDCTEEVFLVAWKKLEQVPAGQDTRPWLFGVARRVLLNQQRSSRRRSRVLGRLASEPSHPASPPDAQLLRGDDRAQVIEAFGHLSPADREVLRLAYWEELRHADIGAILGCSTGAVDVRIHRAIKRLQKVLTRTGHEMGGGTPLLPQRKEERC